MRIDGIPAPGPSIFTKRTLLVGDRSFHAPVKAASPASQEARDSEGVVQLDFLLQASVAG